MLFGWVGLKSSWARAITYVSSRHGWCNQTSTYPPINWFSPTTLTWMTYNLTAFYMTKFYLSTRSNKIQILPIWTNISFTIYNVLAHHTKIAWSIKNVFIIVIQSRIMVNVLLLEVGHKKYDFTEMKSLHNNFVFPNNVKFLIRKICPKVHRGFLSLHKY